MVMVSLDSPLSLRVSHAVVRMLGGLTAIALPHEITDFNVNQRYMFRVLVMLCASLNLTDYDVPASVALLLLYVLVSELLDWHFPDEAGEQAAIAKDAEASKIKSKSQGPWQWQAIGSLMQ